MFIGHFAVAFGAKRIAPRTSLGTLVLAAQWLDLLWPWFLLAGWEQAAVDPGNTRYTPLDFISYPISHSLAAVAGWSVLLAGIYFVSRRNVRAALVVGSLVLSHWVLDWITHRPDLPLYPGGPKVGLGLWNSPMATIAVEALLFVAGVAVYARATRAKDRVGSIALWSFAGFLALIDAANSFGPPPPNIRSVAWAGASMMLLVVWAYWIDRHRVSQQSV